jgi:uncharacterized protein YcnI
MKLTGKAKDKFFEFTIKNYGFDEYVISYLKETLQHALIINFFDEQWIVTTITNTYYDGFHFQWKITDNRLKTHKSKYGFESRQEATEKAIEKANEIYNDILA